MTGTLDTTKFIEFIEEKPMLLTEYERLLNKYDEIVKTLTGPDGKWKGVGADAFASDAEIVKTNIIGLGDILATMCNTLQDALEIFDECDKSIGQANKEVLKS